MEALLAAVAPEDPCGPNLEYDRAFTEIERISQGKPEQQIGETVVPAQEPDWKNIEVQASELLLRSKDLRVAAHLARARLHTGGLVGFSDGLWLLRGLCEGYWDAVHPRLDPDDGNDPTMRVNVLCGVCDAENVLAAVRTAPLASSRRLGHFGLRDIAIAQGEIPAPAGDEKPVDMSTIEGAFTDSDPSLLQATADGIKNSIQCLSGLESFVTERVTVGSGPNFSKLRGLLNQADQVISAQLVRLGVGAVVNGAVQTNGGAPATGAGASLAGEINRREEVIRVLDKICDYYDRNEPSSPIPLLLKRAKRLVPMSFMDIIKDLAPDGVGQIEKIRGEEPQ